VEAPLCPQAAHMQLVNPLHCRRGFVLPPENAIGRRGLTPCAANVVAIQAKPSSFRSAVKNLPRERHPEGGDRAEASFPCGVGAVLQAAGKGRGPVVCPADCGSAVGPVEVSTTV